MQIESPIVIDGSAVCTGSIVLHFAAQAGVRYSIDRLTLTPMQISENANVLEDVGTWCAVIWFASSSSVYGISCPWVDDRFDHPISLYAATKRPTS